VRHLQIVIYYSGRVLVIGMRLRAWTNLRGAIYDETQPK